jgi:hypothetical protein
MMGYKIRKLLVGLIILLPVISYTGCKKQAKCGCSGDMLYPITDAIFDHSAIFYNATGTTAYFQISSGYYADTYYFCNPSDMFAAYNSIGSNEQVKLSGDLYWDCSYVSQAGSSGSYQSAYYKVYNIKVTKLESSLYGKK